MFLERVIDLNDANFNCNVTVLPTILACLALFETDKENYDLKKILGSNTGYFINCANGIENSKVEPEPEPSKSIGNSET